MPVDRVELVYLRKIRRRYDEIGRYVYSNVIPIEGIELRETVDFERYEDAVSVEGYKRVRVGESWGGDGKSGWFRMRFAFPESFSGKPAAAIINIGHEGCVFIDGKPYHGVDANHQEVLLAERAEAGKTYELVIEAMSGAYWQGRTWPAQFTRAEIATINREVEDYWYTLGFLLDLAEALPTDSVRRARLVYGLNESVNAFDYDRLDEESLRESALRASEVLQPLLEKRAEESSVELTCCGHSHIDTAWLWPYAETIRKCGRTFSTVVRYMEQYPEYHFCQSQPQLYEFTREQYPELYKDIQKWVKTGRWEPIGCMWVEPDTNVPSGESLVRQTLYGKRFFQREFGVDTNVLWLPDVFGYSGALPQILKKAGVDYFTSVKLYGNQFNNIPHMSFWWQGIDGTRILAHFPSNGNYNSRVTPEKLRAAQGNYKEKDRSGQALYQFGYGDGGGGPAKDHLQHLKLAKDLEGLPRCVQRPARDLFAELAAEADRFETWRGELYYEQHRGTYTSQARTKRNNRRAELMLRDAEVLSSIAMSLGARYPSDDLAAAWKLVLKNQFHDVLPGSSVPAVYEDVDRDFAQVFSLVEDSLQRAEAYVAERIDTSGPGQAVVVLNTLSWDRIGPVEVPLPEGGAYCVLDADQNPVPAQVSKGGTSLRFSARVPAVGCATYRLVESRAGHSQQVSALARAVPLGSERLNPHSPSVSVVENVKGAAAIGSEREELTVSTTLLENRFFRIALDPDGQIASIYDKRAGREVLAAGAKANVLQLFEDKPLKESAWNIEFYYTEKGHDITDLESIEVEECGPVSGAVRIVRRFGKSTIEQRIVIYPHTPRIDFVTRVDWRERLKLLKSAFPVAINSPTARYEIQFGNLERPTHASTSWDFARFEVCGHKWSDLSEGGYDVSLMNDCKYGYDIRENVMRLTLLRAPTDPDPAADVGEHEFTYSLYPHPGDYADAGTVRAAYELNVPLRTVVTPAHPGSLPPVGSLVSVDAGNVILDTVKKAEDDDSLVLRFYEAHNRRGGVTVSTELPVKDARECDLMERDLGPLSTDQSKISFDISPFEIKSIKLGLG